MGALDVLSKLLGEQVHDWPYSEKSLVQALELKVEQERTRQQYYKLENVNRSIDLVKAAIEAQVPGHCIPMLFNNPTAEEVKSGLLTGSSGYTNVGNSTLYSEAQSSGTDVSLGPPIAPFPASAPPNYKFPPDQRPRYRQRDGYSGTGKCSLSSAGGIPIHKRTKSPARIGAAALAALNKTTTSLRDTEQEHERPARRSGDPNVTNAFLPLLSRVHRRNMSLPALQLFPKSGSSQSDNANGSQKKPLTTVLNFGSWQSYNPQAKKSTNTQPGVRKHRRSRSASTFGVIDLNMANQVKLPESASRSNPKPSAPLIFTSATHNKPSQVSNYDTDSDDQKTCSEPSNNATPIKKPNFVDNLLNS